jgi:hypothetical protein
VNAVVLGFGGVIGAAITFSTVFVLMRILAWVVTVGVPSMISRRSRAVVEWQDCDRNDPPAESVWDSLDRHLHDVPDEVLVDDRPFGGEHEADLDLSEENEAYADDFLAWASELGQRAS